MSCLLVFVEDPELRSSLREILALEGHQVSATAIPSVALGLLREPSLEAVIVDLDDGEPAEELVRSARRERPALRVIALCGTAGSPVRGDVNLAHPCHARELLSAVERPLQARA